MGGLLEKMFIYELVLYIIFGLVYFLKIFGKYILNFFFKCFL